MSNRSIQKISFTLLMPILIFLLTGCGNQPAIPKKNKALSWSLAKQTTVVYYDQTLEIPKNLNFKYDANSKEKVIIHNLKVRKDKESNEKLIEEIAVTNPKLFRTIQRNSKSLNLPELSLAKLPQDVSIKYALKNYATIIKTGRYKTKNGKYSKYKVEGMNFDEKVSYKPTNRVLVNGKDAKIKKSSSSHAKDDYIDFSQGL